MGYRSCSATPSSTGDSTCQWGCEATEQGGAANPFEPGAAERLLQGVLEVTDPGWAQVRTAIQVTAMAAEGDWLYCTMSNNLLWRRPTDASDDTSEAIGMAHIVRSPRRISPGRL